MPDIQISDRLINFILFLPFFFISLAIHEFAHAYSAYKFGDMTAKNEGRLTINPLKHLDLIGSVFMPLVSFSSGLALIGWAKPVPVNASYFKNPYRDDAIVSFAGPFSNFLLACFFTLLIIFSGSFLSGDSGQRVFTLLVYGIYLNIFLFLFNLLPIPPLDGSHILFDLFPNEWTKKYLELGIYGGIILMFFIYSPLWKYFSSIIGWMLELFLKVARV